MKNHRKSLWGSIIAFIIGTSCCWLTAVAVWFGGASILIVLSNYIQEYKTAILIVASLLFIVGLYQLWKHKKSNLRKKQNN